jgi:dihydrofolate reductase
MGKLIVSQFVTVDGVVEDPGGAENSPHGGWAFKFERGEDGDKFKMDEVLEADALLLGRTTFEGFAEAWPSREGPFAEKFNGMPKYVVSSTLSDPEWNNSTVIAPGDIAAAVADLKDSYDGDILVAGSVQLVETLVEEDLVDEVRLMVFPTVVGGGKRAFGATSSQRTLELKESKPVGPDGVVILIYVPKVASGG